jgi:hypothetical protein
VVASQWDPRAPFLSGAVVIAIAGCILIPRLVSLEPTD